MPPLDPRTAKLLGTLATESLAAILGDGNAWSSAKTRARTAVTRDPMDTALATITGATVLFWLAERGVNPKVRTLPDALLFITTCLSVGYADVFAKTQAGKTIASAVMTIGPSVSANLFAPPSEESPPAAPDPALREIADLQRQILARLDALIGTLAAAAERRQD